MACDRNGRRCASASFKPWFSSMKALWENFLRALVKADWVTSCSGNARAWRVWKKRSSSLWTAPLTWLSRKLISVGRGSLRSRVKCVGALRWRARNPSS